MFHCACFSINSLSQCVINWYWQMFQPKINQFNRPDCHSLVMFIREENVKRLKTTHAITVTAVDSIKLFVSATTTIRSMFVFFLFQISKAIDSIYGWLKLKQFHNFISSVIMGHLNLRHKNQLLVSITKQIHINKSHSGRNGTK